MPNPANREHTAIGPDALRAMAVFVEVAKTKSVTRAAEALQLPKSTVSRRVVELERIVGLKLLKRGAQRIELTEEGYEYFRRCRVILEEAAAAHDDLRAARTTARGQLRVASPVDVIWRMVEHLPTFLETYPDIVIDFDFTSRRVDPMSENYDIAFYVGDPPDSALTARKMATIKHVLYAAPAYVGARGAPASPGDLIDHNCIRTASFANHAIEQYWTLLRGDERLEVPVGGSISLNSIGIIKQLVMEGVGIASLPPVLCGEDEQRGALVKILPEWIRPPTSIFALTASRLEPAKVKLFLDFASNVFTRAIRES